MKEPGRTFKSRIILGDKVIDDTNIVSFTYTDNIIAGDDFEIGTAIMSSMKCELLKDVDINNIPTYGRNLYLDGSYESGIMHPVRSGNWEIINSGNSKLGEKVLKCSRVDGGHSYHGRDIEIDKNTAYTVSVWVWISSDFMGSSVRLYIEGTGGTLQTNAMADMNKKEQWQRLTITGISGSVLKARILAYVFGQTKGYVLYDCMKLEKGNTLTEWSPAPEDLTRVNDIKFENREALFEIGVKLEDGSFEYVPIGLYTIEKPEVGENKISFQGVDRMYKFEKEYITKLTYPTTLFQIAKEICTQAGVELVNTSFPNSDYIINYKPNFEGISLRRAIAQVAELAGGYARITRDGKLSIFNLTIGTGSQIIKYTNNLDLYTGNEFFTISDEVDLSKVMMPSLSKDNYINFTNKELELAQINKIIVKLGAEEAIMGSGSNPYYIKDNMFCQDPTKVVKGLYDALYGLAYLPLNTKWQGDPSMDCGDTIEITTNDKDLILSIFTSRSITYSGGVREEAIAVGKSDTERDSTPKGNLTQDMEKAFTEIKVLAGEITETVKQEDFESYKKQTAQEITSKVSRGEDLKTEVTQNAESWTLSIGGKLNGTKYRFDGNSFTIGGTSGDTATHTPSMSKYTHSDGSYTQISSAGLERFVAGQPKKYHYLMYSGEVVSVNTGSTTITLPSDFRGKQFVVSVMIMGLSPTGDVISGFFAYPASYDYPNGKCTINLNVYSFSYYLSSYTVGSTVYYSLQSNPYSTGTFSIAYTAIA